MLLLRLFLGLLLFFILMLLLLIQEHLYAWLLPHDMNTGSVKAYKIAPLVLTAAVMVCNLVIRGLHCSLLCLASCSYFSSGQWILIICVFLGSMLPQYIVLYVCLSKKF